MRLNFFNIDEFCENVPAVTSNKIYNKRGFHPDGLFSEKIFGPTRTCYCGCGDYWGRSKQGETCSRCGVDITHCNVRRKRFAKIELPFKVINPIMYYLISKVGKVTITKIIDNIIFDDKIYGYYWDEDKSKFIPIMAPENEEDTPESPEGVTVYSGPKSVLEIIKFLCEKYKETSDHWQFIFDNLDKFYMKNLIVSPPEFRPVSKTKDVQMRDELNRFYMTIINFSLMMNEEDLNSVSETNIASVNFRNLQKHIFSIYEYIFGKFSKKTGLIRGHILGKRIDFSSRAVISPDPTINLDECSIPYLMAMEMFKLDIANVLLERRVFKRYDPTVEYIDKCISNEDYALLDIVKEVTEGKYVMLNRQPTLHRMGVLSFKIKINSDYVIRIHPLICEPYNADFDGDQMAVYLSLYDDTQEECREKLCIKNNLLSPSTGDLVLGINQDIILGLYLLTKETPGKEVVYDGISTYEGRVQFNAIFPENFPFINRTITKRQLFAMLNVFTKTYDDDPDLLARTFDRLKEMGFRQTTTTGVTMSLKDMSCVISMDQISEICDNPESSIREKFFKLQDPNIIDRVKAAFPYSQFIESGSRGSWDQVNQLIFCRGFVSNSQGDILPTPVKSNLVNGLDRDEFFTSSFGSRKALLDVALNTGVSGYLTRKLVYCSVNLEADLDLDDCGTEDTFSIVVPATKSEELDPNRLVRSMIGRWYKTDNGFEEITADNYRTLVGKTVQIRSPIFCTSEKVCRKCYGTTINKLHSKYVGIIAAQAAGEVATQLTLRTFHISGVAQMREGGDDDQQQDIINDLTNVKKMLHANKNLTHSQLIMELFKIYSHHRTLLMIHFECIVSQMMRMGNKRWRLTEDRDINKYELVSIENVPSKESFLLALAFAKPYNYIVSGILGSDNTTDGILERIMLNQI